MKISLQVLCGGGGGVVVVVVVVLLVFANFTNAQSISKPTLRQKLLNRLQEDQKIRNEIPDDPTRITPEYIARLRGVDRANTAWIKKIIRKYGFPIRSQVCEDGVYAAFIIIQHADFDREFQKQVLPLLEKAVRAGEAPAFYFAYLTDRILTNEGKPQRYGSQLMLENGNLVALPIQDEAAVDERRSALGLPKMSEYLKGQKTLEMPQCRLSSKSMRVMPEL